jgi:hypothetical protein
MQGWRQKPGDAERMRLSLAKDQEAEVARLLTPAQARRFRQLALQFLGPAAFTDPELLETLALTAGQKVRVRAIQSETGSHGPRFGPPGFPDDSRKKALDKILDELTPSQRQKWDELVGEAFKFKGNPGGGPPRPKGEKER